MLLGGNSLQVSILDFAYKYVHLTPSHIMGPEIAPVSQSVQLLSHIRLFVTPQTAAHQASLSITNSQSLLKLMSIELVMPSNHLILCRPLLLLPSIFPSIRVFSNESVLLIRWPKYWSFSFNISPSSEYPGLISFRIDWFDLLAVESSPTTQFESSNSSALSFSLWSNSLILKRQTSPWGLCLSLAETLQGNKLSPGEWGSSLMLGGRRVNFGGRVFGGHCWGAGWWGRCTWLDAWGCPLTSQCLEQHICSVGCSCSLAGVAWESAFLSNSGLTAAALPRTTLWVVRVCQTLTQAQVSAASSRRLTPSSLSHTLWDQWGSWLPNCRAQDCLWGPFELLLFIFSSEPHPSHYSKHSPKIESYYIHCFPFYLFIWHFYRLQKKQLNLSRVICTTSAPAIYCLRVYLPTLAKSSSECRNLGLSQRWLSF